jgi:hypothetical protein
LRKDFRNSFLILIGQAMRKQFSYSSKRFNAGATHIPHCPHSTPKFIADISPKTSHENELETRLKLIFYRIEM